MRKWIIALSALLLLTFVSCGNRETPPDLPPENPPSVITIETKIYAETFVRDDEEIAAYSLSVPYMTGDDSDAVRTFNEYFDKLAMDIIEHFEKVTLPTAESDYDSAADWGEKLYFTSLTYTENRSGDYLGYTLDLMESNGDTSRYTDFYAAMFDADKGTFLTVNDFTDETEVFQNSLADAMARQIEEQGMEEGCYEDWREKLRNLASAQVCFTDEGAMVVFPEKTVSDGKIYLLISYEGITERMNDYGRGVTAGFMN